MSDETKFTAGGITFGPNVTAEWIRDQMKRHEGVMIVAGPPVAGFAARELARLAAENVALRRRVSELEGRLARVLSFISWGSRATRGRVWSSRRTGGKR